MTYAIRAPYSSGKATIALRFGPRMEGFGVEREHGARVTSRRQVTIPVYVRRSLGLNPGDVLVIRESAEGYTLEKAATRFRFDDFVGCLQKARLRAPTT